MIGEEVNNEMVKWCLSLSSLKNLTNVKYWYYCLSVWSLIGYVFFAGDIGNYYYGQGHPMKPHRIRMTHNLLLNYGLYRKMEIYVCFLTIILFNIILYCMLSSNMILDVNKLIYITIAFLFFLLVLIQLSFTFQRPHKATAEEMTKYHSDDYIKFLRSIRPDNMSEFSKQMQRCK